MALLHKKNRVRKIAIAAMLAHFVWCLFNLTGLSIAGHTLVVSAFVDEPIDVPFDIFYGIALCLFVWRERVGKWVCLIYWSLIALFQGSMYFQGDFSGYYAFFSNEGTHRLFPQSAVFLVKDTYHIINDILIAGVLVSLITFCIVSARRKKKGGPAR